MGVCDYPLMDKVCGAVDFATNPAGTVTDGIGAWIAKSAGQLAFSAADLATKAVDETTAIDLNAGWFRDNYELLLPIGLALTVGTDLQLFVVAGFRSSAVGEVQDVALGHWGVVPCLGEVVFEGVVGGAVEGGLVVVPGRLAVFPPCVSGVDT